MDLVVVETAESSGGKSDSSDHAPIFIDAAKRQLLGLRTVEVARSPLSVSVRTVGRVTYDERLVHHVHTRYTAFVEHVYADFTGKAVTKGEALASLYSPELYATQKEYLLALKAARSLSGSTSPGVAVGGSNLLDAARERLLLWEINPADIEKIEKAGEPLRAVDVYAPISGVIVGRAAYHGMKVMPTDVLFDIVDLSRVWVLADVYEYELPKIKIGEAADVTLSYWPGKKWPASVTYIYPSVDEKTRTVRVRLELSNPRGELKPEMFADVTIRGAARNVLQVPDDAILDGGQRKIAFVVKDDGHIEPRDVQTGDRSEGHVEILSGVSAGEKVALRANFLIDSESRLKAALLSMKPSENPADQKSGSSHQH
jgi:Cu(I)/Ag(I) efflux system membrane fusion protein